MLVEQTCQAVEIVLQKNYHIDPQRAHDMVINSAFYEMLEENPDYVGHRRAEYWAKQVIEEFSVLN
jgi:hypothetical protein